VNRQRYALSFSWLIWGIRMRVSNVYATLQQSSASWRCKQCKNGD